MRILTKPKVYLILRPQLVEEGFRAFLEDNDLEWPTPREGVPDAQLGIELAGEADSANRVDCEGRREGPAHGSVCEHPHWSFIVTGAGRGFSHEQVRHRVGVAYSQLSTRYCDFEREGSEGTWDPGFVVPPLAQLSEETQNSLIAWYEECRTVYAKHVKMIERDILAREDMMETLGQDFPNERDMKRTIRKAARGAARDGLPIGAEAIMTISCNARSIWNMAYMRASKFAEAPIRDVFVQILQIMESEAPALFNKWVYQKVWDGSLEAKPPRDKL
jgi:thymidylate synthase (FAD)